MNNLSQGKRAEEIKPETKEESQEEMWHEVVKYCNVLKYCEERHVNDIGVIEHLLKVYRLERRE